MNKVQNRKQSTSYVQDSQWVLFISLPDIITAMTKLISLNSINKRSLYTTPQCNKMGRQRDRQIDKQTSQWARSFFLNFCFQYMGSRYKRSIKLLGYYPSHVILIVIVYWYYFILSTVICLCVTKWIDWLIAGWLATMRLEFKMALLKTCFFGIWDHVRTALCDCLVK